MAKFSCVTNEPVTILRSKKRKRTISLSIRHDGCIVLQAPYHVSHKRIQDFLHSRKKWLADQLKKIKEMPPSPAKKNFVDGEEFFYLGQPHKLKITEIDDASPFSFSGTEFMLHKTQRENARKLFTRWYRDRTYRKTKERTDFYGSLMNVSPVKINITSALSRWGSCSAINTLNFPWRLSLLPEPIIDYIIVHELAHITEKNHKKNFWGKVSVMLPDYKQRRLWLKKNGQAFYFE